LFTAPAEYVSNLLGKGICCVDGMIHDQRLALGIGCDFIVRCPSCARETAIDASESASQRCLWCKSGVPGPTLSDENNSRAACFSCLRAGRVAITQNTEFGMVRWQDAIAGLTHGVPGLRADRLGNNGFNLGPLQDEDMQWRGVYVPPTSLLELV